MQDHDVTQVVDFNDIVAFETVGPDVDKKSLRMTMSLERKQAQELAAMLLDAAEKAGRILVGFRTQEK